MITSEIKQYEGDDISGPVLDLMLVSGISGTIKALTLIASGNVTDDAVFNLTKNGVALFTGADRPTVLSGTNNVPVTGLNITVAETDALFLDLEECGSEGVTAPIILILKVDDGAPAGLSVEEIQDMIASFLVAGSNVSFNYNDDGDQLTISSINTDTQITAEEIQDIVAAFISQGTNVTVVYDDAANTLTISSTGGGSGASYPPGGTTGQALVKASAADNDVEWATVSNGGGGSVTPDTGGLGWLPTDEADCALWLPSSNVSESDAQLLASWNDQSGNARNAVEATDKPTSYLSLLNNRAGVRFASMTNQKLTTAAFSFKHLFVLARYNVSQNGQFNNYNGLVSGIAVNNDNLILTGNGANGNGGAWYVADWQYAPDYRYNGLNQSTSNNNANLPTAQNQNWIIYEISRETAWSDGLMIGNDRDLSRSFGGDIMEVIAFGNVKAEAARRDVLRYFAKTFNLKPLIP